MKSGKLLFIVIIFTLLVSACQSNSGSQKNPQNNQDPSQEDISPPSDEGSAAEGAQDAYPAPQSEPPTAVPAVLYPMLADGDEVYWSQAKAMIMNSEVDRIIQTHELKVTLLLKDGRAIITEERNIDEVLRVIELCGEVCSNIAVATE